MDIPYYCINFMFFIIMTCKPIATKFQGAILHDQNILTRNFLMNLALLMQVFYNSD